MIRSKMEKLMASDQEKVRNVLYVEDSEIMTEVVVEVLPQFEVESAATFDEAVALLEAKDFAFVLTDLYLAGSKSGLDLCRHIRDRGWQMPVLVTTSGDWVDSDHVRLAGAQAFVPKNGDFETVLNAIIDAIV